MSRQTTFQVNISQRRRRLANVQVVVKPDCTSVNGVAWGNESAVPLALGILLYAARSFAVDEQLLAAIDLAITTYDPSAQPTPLHTEFTHQRQTPLIAEEDDIPF